MTRRLPGFSTAFISRKCCKLCDKDTPDNKPAF